MAQASESNGAYCKYLFKKVDNDPEHHWQWQICPKKRTCAPGAGWSNLIGHLSVDHPSCKDFESVSKALQGGIDKLTSRAQARKLFDDLIVAHSTDDRELIHLSEDAAIVNNSHFENGVVKLRNGK